MDAAQGTAATPKKKVVKPKAKKTTDANKVSTINLVKEAIAANKDRKGTALPTIKKYISQHHPKVDVNRINSHIKKALKTGVEKGTFVRVGGKGTGASGSFKLGEKKAAKPKKAVKPKSPKKKAAPKKVKAATPKKAAVKPKVKKPKSPAAKKPKSPAKKTVKKAPAAAKKPAAKKPAAKKPKSPATKKPKAAPKKA